MKRATTGGEREARRRHILSATAHLLESWSLEDVNVDRIAELAGVAKGTVYLYFRTREELILEVFDRHHDSWLDAFETALDESTDDLTPHGVGRVVVSTLVERPLLLRLYGRVGGLLGGSISPQAAERYRIQKAGRIARVARALNRRLPQVTAFQGERWMLRVEAFIAGIAALTLSPAATTGVVETAGGTLLHGELESELQYIAVTMLLSP